MTSAGDDRLARNGLMIAFAFTLPYHVMRSAAASGTRVHVLGHGASRGLRMSCHCRAYSESRFGGDPEILLAEIDDLVRRHAIDIVFPSDDVSTRLLAALGDRLPVRSSPVPTLTTFDLLNDKWNFTQFCLSNGVRAPQGWLFDDAAELRHAIRSGKIALPITLKPTNRSASIGVFHIREPGELAQIDAIDYRPVLAQRHIIGETIGISVLCDRGRIVAHATQRRDTARFELFANPDLLANVSRLAALTGYSGPANFDVVLSAEDGLSYLVECNPRFWYTIHLSMIAGLNFVDLALAGSRPETVTLDRGELRLSLRKILRRPWRATRFEWKFLAYNLSDPIVYLAQHVKSYDDSEVAVPVGEMSRYQPAEQPAAAASVGRRTRFDSRSGTAAGHPVPAVKAP
jgi:ATP-grasp domain-containing protein